MAVARESGDPRPRLAATVGSLVEAGHAAPRDALAALSHQGYAFVQWSATTPGMRPRDLDSSARRGLLSELRRLELRCAGVDAWVPPGHFLDPTTIDRAVTALEQSVRFAADLAMPGDRRPTVSLLVPTESEVAAQTAIAAQVREALAHIASLAEHEGVAVADHSLEPCVIGTAGPSGNSSGFGVGIDPASLIAAGRDPAAAVLKAGASLASARLVDCFRSGLRGPILEPGESRLDVTAYRVAIELSVFDRPLVVDARQWRDPLGGLIATLERWTGRQLRATPLDPASQVRG
jgi:sugar phosphate isomerase/epimerase